VFSGGPNEGSGLRAGELERWKWYGRMRGGGEEEVEGG
jgi:hypothetical protein